MCKVSVFSEIIINFAALFNDYKEANQQKYDMNRREFLKKTAVAAAGAAIVQPASAILSNAESAGLMQNDERPLKVLLINGSPRRDGNTFTALKEVEAQLLKYGITTEIFQIGRRAVRMCINCGGCKYNNDLGCVFDDDFCNVIAQKMATSDAMIVGTPVYYGQPNGGILALLQRLFFSNGKLVQNKPAAAIAVCRRGGATAALQTLNMMFEMMNMPIVTSQYWNIAYGAEKGEVRRDTEGMQTMRTLGSNMAWLLKKMHTGGDPLPERERTEYTNFIR